VTKVRIVNPIREARDFLYPWIADMHPSLTRSLRRLIYLVAFGAPSCRHAPQAPLTMAVACPPATAIDTTWQSRDLRAFQLRLPPGFEPGKRPECYEGGVYFARDSESVGYCMEFYAQPSGAASAGPFTFLGAPASMTCSRNAKGNWWIHVTPSGKSAHLWVYARARTEATAAQLITALLAAERPQ